MSNIIDGRAIAKTTYQGLRKECESKGIQPHLTVILVGDDQPAKYMLEEKDGITEKVVFFSEQTITLPESTTEQELLDILEGLKQKDDSVDGILVQLPYQSISNSQKSWSV